MKLLTPGTGNQSANRQKAIKYIRSNIFDVDNVDFKSGNIVTSDGAKYHVCAFAESGAAFISTPGKDNSEYSIYASGLMALMFRQLRNDERTFIYEVDPSKITTKPNSSSAEWKEVNNAATRIWVCTKQGVKCTNRVKET